MKTLTRWLPIAVVFGTAVCLLPGGAGAEELTDEARAVVDEYQKAASVVQAKADAELAVVQKRLLPRLKALQDKYCRAAKLDEAVAVRDTIRGLLGIRPDPGGVAAAPEDIGRSFLYFATGSTSGLVWGSEVYTSDSHLGTAAVHSGVLKPGEKGVVRVRIIGGQKSYAASTAHGVTSQEYGTWTVSFTVERPKDLAGLDL